MLKTVVVLIGLFIVDAVATASEQPVSGRSACSGQNCARCHKLSSEEAAELLRSLKVTVQSIKQAPIQGMFEVLAKREDQEGIIYVDYAKKHIMQGVVVNAATMEAISSHVKEPSKLK